MLESPLACAKVLTPEGFDTRRGRRHASAEHERHRVMTTHGSHVVYGDLDVYGQSDCMHP